RERSAKFDDLPTIFDAGSGGTLFMARVTDVRAACGTEAARADDDEGRTQRGETAARLETALGKRQGHGPALPGTRRTSGDSSSRCGLDTRYRRLARTPAPLLKLHQDQGLPCRNPLMRV